MWLLCNLFCYRLQAYSCISWFSPSCYEVILILGTLDFKFSMWLAAFRLTHMEVMCRTIFQEWLLALVNLIWVSVSMSKTAPTYAHILWIYHLWRHKWPFILAIVCAAFKLLMKLLDQWLLAWSLAYIDCF